MAKTKLVVYNEHTLGFITPEQPNLVQHLRASILKGATFSTSKESDIISKKDNVRLASESDFNEYRCVFGGFSDTQNYEYAK